MNMRHFWAHFLACITIVIWGTTFIVSKILLHTFSPLEILCIRFSLGALGLMCIEFFMYRKQPKKRIPFRQELVFFGAGLSGVTIYYLLESIALTHTFASNVGIIVSIAPLTTALFVPLFLKEERLAIQVLLGFIIASAGVALVMFNGTVFFQLRPLGDILAILSTFGWACYSILLKKIDTSATPVITYTKKIFLYGLLTMIPFITTSKVHFSRDDFSLQHIVLLLFLGLGASAACFISWNYAVKTLGVLKTSAYIYLSPFVSLLTAAIVLQEPVTPMAIGGCFLILGGLSLSEYRKRVRIKIRKSLAPEGNA